MAKKVSFWSTDVGHAVISLGVTAVTAVLSRIVNDPSLAASLGIGGTVITVLKLAVDRLRSSVPSFNG